MNPFPIYRCGFRPIREVHEWLHSNTPHIPPETEIRLSDALPGRISEGEATLHPKFFEICKMVRQRLPNNPLHITTNGSKLTEEFVSKMVELKPFRVWLSYHSTSVDNWRKIMGMSAREHEIATNAFKLLNEAEIFTCAAIVTLPNLVGYDDIEKSLMFFNEYTQGVQWWQPGYSKLASDKLKEIMEIDIKEFTDFTHKMNKQCNKLTIHWNSDPDKLLVVDIYPIMHESMQQGFDKVMWLTGEVNYDRLTTQVAHENQFVPNEHYVQKVVNKVYGGTINCNGLLMIEDMRAAIESSRFEPDLIVTPNSMLDRLGNDLKGTSNTHLTNLPVWWRS